MGPADECLSPQQPRRQRKDNSIYEREASLAAFRLSCVTEVLPHVAEEGGGPFLSSSHMVLICSRKVSRQFTGLLWNPPL